MIVYGRKDDIEYHCTNLNNSKIRGSFPVGEITKIRAPMKSACAFTARQHKWFTNPSLEVEADTKVVDTYIKLSAYISISPVTFDQNLDKIIEKLKIGVSLSEIENFERMSKSLNNLDMYTLVISVGLALTACSCLITCIALRYGRRRIPEESVPRPTYL